LEQSKITKLAWAIENKKDLLGVKWVYLRGKDWWDYKPPLTVVSIRGTLLCKGSI